MGKLKFDVSHVEDQGSIQLVKPNVVYKVKIEEVDDRRPAKDGAMVRIRVVGGKFDKTPVWTWLGFGETSEWRLKQFVRAVTGGKDKMDLDPVGKIVCAVLDHREYEGEMRNNLKTWLPKSAMDEQEEPEDDDNDIPEDEDDDDEDADVDEDDDSEEDEDEDEDEDDDEEEDDPLDSLNRKALKAYIEENDLDISVKKSMSDDEVRDAIRAAESDQDEDDDDEEDEDFSKLDDEELDEELESRGLKTTGSRKAKLARLEKDAASNKAPF